MIRKAAAVVVLLSAVIIMAVSCQNAADLEYKRYYTAGKLLYQSRCQNCHGQNGEGLSALIPPLTDTAFIAKRQHELPCFVRDGVSSMLVVSGKAYDGRMPPSGLVPVQIAEVLTYVGNSFGNKRGVIDVNTVTKDLENCP